jgi:serine/tyrosine/threonine adenylyltransferase
MPISERYRAEQLHAELGGEFFDKVEAAKFPQLILRYRNQRWAARVGLDTLSDDEWRDYFGRFLPLPESFEHPLALRYHGHQFQVYNPELGDGRGFLFAQLRDAEDGRLLDLGTKGSGRTPWSRQGDGRLTLKGGMREILATEMLEALGVDTSKTFSLIETGEALTRGDEPSPTRSSVLVRLSHSHIRIGTFQRLAFFEDKAAIERLLDYTLRHYYPQLLDQPQEHRALAFLETVIARVARLGARYMTAGFVHGVLNSDNINVTGESFDYGPWRFAPTYDPNFTAAYFDQTGLYAFGRQPGALGWNLSRLAECLLPLTGLQAAESALANYQDALQQEFRTALLERLGLLPVDMETDARLAKSVIEFLVATRAPFEQFFSIGAADRRARSAPAGAPLPHFMRWPNSRRCARICSRIRRPPARRRTTPISKGRSPAQCSSKKSKRSGRPSPSATTGIRCAKSSRKSPLCATPTPRPRMPRHEIGASAPAGIHCGLLARPLGSDNSV